MRTELEVRTMMLGKTKELILLNDETTQRGSIKRLGDISTICGWNQALRWVLGNDAPTEEVAGRRFSHKVEEI